MANMSDDGSRLAADKMRAAGAHEEAIRAFENAYARLVTGQEAMLPSAELEPAGDVAAFEQLPDADPAQALASVAVIKLNGGLATTMGLQQPKSLMEARDGRSFLDIIIGQTLALRRRHGVGLPLVLMDSDVTREATLAALHDHPEIGSDGLEPDFLQSMIPKLDADTLAPVSWPAAPALEWCPPGHGDVYGALRRSGMLATLLEAGYRYAMISNADNLGARVDARVAAHIAAAGMPFLMEVVQGTEADRKGGHVARRRADGQLVPRLQALALLQHEQPVDRSGGARGHDGAQRRCARAAADRQPQDRRPARRVLAAGHPARVGDGRGDRELPRRRPAARPAHALRPRQDDRRSARAALRRLRGGR
jgi:UTP--glucose-1-phosphate uridylyltransferase